MRGTSIRCEIAIVNQERSALGHRGTLDPRSQALRGPRTPESIARREGLEDAVVIAITSYGEEQAIRRSREAGFDHHLIKPVDLDALLKLLGPAPTARTGSLTTSS
jgi:CheY-like chemotaxis protein